MTGTATPEPKAASGAARAPAFIAGIGASAGGLRSFRALLPGLPKSADIAWVLLQHLDPAYPSLLPELLKDHSPLPVLEVADGMAVEGGKFYTCPAGQQCRIEEGVFRLEPLAGPGPRHSVDLLLTSIARAWPERCAAVILSGAGQDGLEGSREIKAAGGWVLAEDPDGAEFDSMPRSLCDQLLADIVRPAAELGREVGEIAELAAQTRQAFSLPEDSGQLRLLLEALEKETGFNFHRYRDAMLCRRINRRLLANRVHSLGEYQMLLKHSRSEARSLIKDIFIPVTGFFRDPPVFQRLERLLAELVKKRGPDEEVRIWSVGCATGEEAYTLALIVAELLQGQGPAPAVKIFATDIDADSIETARGGIYGAKSVERLPANLLRRYFQPLPNGWQVGKELREMVVFAVHDATEDPPFSHLDLLSCRNLLIYFTPRVQLRLLERFHYSLKPEGLLLLGIAESVGGAESLFTAVDNRAKLYRRGARARSNGPSFSSPANGGRPARAPSSTPREDEPERMSWQQQMRDIFFAHFAPAAVLIDKRFQLIHLHGRARSYLSLPEGDVKLDILNMVSPELRTDLRLAVQQARRKGRASQSRPIPLASENSQTPDRAVTLTAIPPASGPNAAQDGEVLLVFEEKPLGKPAAAPAGSQDERVETLEEELAARGDQLRSANEALEAAHQELQSLGEEYQTTTEELKSSNEQFQTTNEELQSTNEELSSVNEELRTRSMELARANTELDGILNNVLAGIVVLDPDLRVTRYSENCLDLLDLSPAHGEGTRLLANRLGALPGLQAMMRQALDSGEQLDRDLQLEEKAFQLRLIPVLEAESHAVQSLILTFQDDTRRRAQEQESRLLAAIVRNSPDAIIVHDLEGRILNWNDGAQRMYGWRRDDAQGLHIEDLIDKGDRRRYRAFLKKLLEGKADSGLELHGLPRGGKPVDISLNASVLEGRDGNADRIAVIHRDITEKNASERKLNALVESTPDPIIIVESDGSIQRVNRQAEVLFGYSRKQLLGRSYKMLIPERYRPQHDVYHRQFQERPVMREMGSGLELSCLNAEGEEIPVEIGLSPVVVRDEATTLVRFRDVRKEREEQRALREAKQAADEANRSKSRFLAAASHDLRQPLQSISMYLGVLAGRLPARERAKVADQARMALDSTSKLLNSLLNITKLEAGKVQPEIEAFPISRLLERVYNTEAPLAREKSHRFALAQSSARVSSDPALLEQLVTNLVANAIKYTPRHGHVLLGCRRHGRFLKIQVSDNGPGIASDELDLIFDEYRQLEYNGHYLGKGLGLGLSIVKLIAELMHLHMEVKSVPGRGSSFSVLVPLAEGGEEARPKAAEKAASKRKKVTGGKLLLVDDDLAVLESTSLFLELAGFTVLTATGSASALEAVRNQRPDLIISDFGLGEDVNGIQVIQSLREALGRTIPAIVVTGDTSDSRAQEAQDAGCAIVRKPIEAQALQQAVEGLLEH